MDKRNTKKKPEKIVTKPYMTGTPMDAATLRRALKFFGGLIVMGIAYLLLSSMLVWDSAILRILTNAVVAASALLLFYYSGVSDGTQSVNTGEIMYKRQEEGKTVDEADRRACYHPLKGFVTGLIGTIPFLLCAVVLACIAHQQLYGLSALPSWLSGYENLEEVGAALSYYNVTTGMGIEGVLRVIVRMMMMPMLNIAGTGSSATMLLMERLSPLFMLLPALAYGFGCTQGVTMRTRVHSSIAASNRKKARKEKKERRQRAAKQPEQLN